MKCHEVEHRAEGEPHGAGGNPLPFVVKIHAAGKDIGTRQSPARQECAVCAAADRFDDGFDAGESHRLFKPDLYLRLATQIWIHIGIGVVHRHFDFKAGFFVGDLLGDSAYLTFEITHRIFVEVA